MEEDKTYVLDEKAIRAVWDFYRSIYAADVIFKPCQDKAFRQHVKSCVAAPNAQAAFKQIGELFGETP